jgi:LPS export ABC transporter protein LptC
MRRKVPAVLAVLLLAALAGAWYLWQRMPDMDELRRAAEDIEMDAEVGVDLSLQDIELSHGTEGRLQWRLTAKKANYLQEQGVVEVTEPRMVYFFAQGTKQAERMPGNLTIRAAGGTVRQEEQAATLRNDVVAVYKDMTITAEELEYDGPGQRVVLRGNVLLESPDFDCRAQVMRFSLKTQDLVAEQGVAAELATQGIFDAQ